MTEIKTAITLGNASLKEKLNAINGPLAYEETAYHLPVAYALTGRPVHTTQEAVLVYNLTSENPFVACETLMAFSEQGSGREPAPYTGFIGDAVLRKLGYSLVDGSILGLALVIGTPGNADTASRICRELQEKYMLTFLAGDVVPSLSSASVKLGLEYRLIPLGSTSVHGVHFVDIITRVALMFGGVVPGDAGRLLAYANQRAKAIAIVFPGLDN